jgi:hypothetical protein
MTFSNWPPRVLHKPPPRRSAGGAGLNSPVLANDISVEGLEQFRECCRTRPPRSGALPEQRSAQSAKAMADLVIDPYQPKARPSRRARARLGADRPTRASIVRRRRFHALGAVPRDEVTHNAQPRIARACRAMAKPFTELARSRYRLTYPTSS